MASKSTTAHIPKRLRERLDEEIAEFTRRENMGCSYSKMTVVLVEEALNARAARRFAVGERKKGAKP